VKGILNMNEIQHCLDLRRVGSDPGVFAAALAVRNFGTLFRNGGNMYGQPDCIDALYPSEIEAFLFREVESAQKTTRFLFEWHMSW
jgi:hypothetical protein